MRFNVTDFKSIYIHDISFQSSVIFLLGSVAKYDLFIFAQIHD